MAENDSWEQEGYLSSPGSNILRAPTKLISETRSASENLITLKRALLGRHAPVIEMISQKYKYSFNCISARWRKSFGAWHGRIHALLNILKALKIFSARGCMSTRESSACCTVCVPPDFLREL